MGLYDGWPPTATDPLPFTNEQEQAFSDQAHSMREERAGPPTPRPNTGAECFGPAGASARPRSDYGVRLDKLESDAKIHAVTDPIISGNLSERIEALERQFLRSPDSFDVNNMVGVLNEAIDKLIKRIDIHDKQITELDQSALRAQCAPPIGDAAHFKILYARSDATKKYLMELEAGYMGQFAEHQKVIAAVEEIARGAADAIDALRSDVVKNLQATDNRLNAGAQAIDELSKSAGKRLDAIENILRVRAEMADFIGRYSKKAAELNAGDFSNFGVTYVRPPKPIIKGGWVNAYPNGQMHFHQTREAADNAYSLVPRIACIQIPDITEGEGL